MGLFESSFEKEMRLASLDRENELGREIAKLNGVPFFGSRYADDYRPKDPKVDSLNEIIKRNSKR